MLRDYPDYETIRLHPMLDEVPEIGILADAATR